MQKYMIVKIFFISIMGLLLIGCDSKKEARETIEQKGITYNIQEFSKAIMSKNTELIDLFIAAGIDVSNDEVLASVLLNSDPSVFKKLLDAGLNPNAKINGEPLIITLSSDPIFYDSLKILLEYESTNINITTDKLKRKNLTALHQAVLSKNFKAFELLLQKGANPKLVTQSDFIACDVSGMIVVDGFHPGNLYEQDLKDVIHFIELMGKQFNPNAKIVYLKNDFIDSVIGYSVYLMDDQLVKLMLDNGGNPKILDSDGNTLLVFPPKHFDKDKCIKIEKLLIAHGTNKNATNKAGIRKYTPCKEMAKQLEAIVNDAAVPVVNEATIPLS